MLGLREKCLALEDRKKTLHDEMARIQQQEARVNEELVSAEESLEKLENSVTSANKAIEAFAPLELVGVSLEKFNEIARNIAGLLAIDVCFCFLNQSFT
jgi:lipid II:glycine glycyltransferase (peptidoglycan interpeptide bridge formation enzyme)